MIIDKATYDDLRTKRDPASVSIYIPTDRANSQAEDRIRWKNACQRAAQYMTEQGIDPRTIRKTLKPAFALVDDARFWSHLSDGLCGFYQPHFNLHLVMPIHFQGLVEVADQFIVGPLLPYLRQRQRFFLLLVSKKEIKFFEGNQHSISPVIIEDLIPNQPDDFYEEGQSELQIHSAGSSIHYHGSGTTKDEQDRIEHFFRAVDKGLMQMLHDERIPMILAGLDHLIPIYRSVCQYQSLHAGHLSGNLLDADPVLLHQMAWPLIREQMEQEDQVDPDAFQALAHAGRGAVLFSDIKRHAREGRIQSLLVDAAVYAQKAEIDRREVEEVVQASFEQGAIVSLLPAEELPVSTTHFNAVLRY